mgnify:FL=1
MKSEKLKEGKATRLANLQIDLWAEQITAISLFYKTEFPELSGINWKNVKLPIYTDERPRLEYIHSGIRGCNDVVRRYHEKFGNLAQNDYSRDPDMAIHSKQERSSTAYPFAWAGTIEPDNEHLNKSYNMFKDDGNTYMIPIEGLIAAYRYRCETGEMLDIKGVTFFHATGSEGHVLGMCRNGNEGLNIGVEKPRSRDDNKGPRQVNIC